jgi:hypothetical protein
MNFVVILLAKTIAIGLTLIYSLAWVTHFIGAYSTLKNAYPNSVVGTGDDAPFEIVVLLFCIPIRITSPGDTYHSVKAAHFIPSGVATCRLAC